MDRVRPTVGASDNLLENNFLRQLCQRHAFHLCRREGKKLKIEGGNYVTQYYF